MRSFALRKFIIKVTTNIILLLQSFTEIHVSSPKFTLFRTIRFYDLYFTQFAKLCSPCIIITRPQGKQPNLNSTIFGVQEG